jgi:hypothetical protein
MSAPWLPLAILGGFALSAAVGDLISQEIRGRLDALPRAVLLLAARRLPDELRAEKLTEWEGELHEILRGAEALPVTRLWRGLHYTAGITRAAPTIARTLAPQDRSPSHRKRSRALIRPSGAVATTTARFLGFLGFLGAAVWVYCAVLGAVDALSLNGVLILNGSHIYVVHVSLALRVLFVGGAVTSLASMISFIFAKTTAVARATAGAAAFGTAIAIGDYTFPIIHFVDSSEIVFLCTWLFGTAGAGEAARRARRWIKTHRQRAQQHVPA